MSFVDRPVTVEVPATCANLGPGFDCLGLALDLHDRLTARVSDELVVEIDGEGAGELPRDEGHLVLRAMAMAFDLLGERPAAVHLRCDNRIPQGRGLGSSSAAIVGGIVLARSLVVGGDELLPESRALDLANALEGHPDNVAPALLGGFVISGRARDDVWAHQAPIDPRVSAVVFVPPHGVRTEVARGLLPDVVPHADAAANSGRAALLVAALASAPDRLLRATEEFLHQSYREQAMPESLALVRRLRADSVPAVVSGAGPTVLAFTAPGLAAPDQLVSRCPQGWAARHQAVDPRGARQV